MPTTTDVTAYGAVGNGSTDDTAAINAAVAATTSGGIIYFPAGRYRVTSTITVTGAKSVVGLSYGSETIFGNYATIIADPTVSPVLTIDGGSGSRVQAAVKSIGISRAQGSTPVGVGLLVINTNLALIEDVTINRHSFGLQLHDAVSTKMHRLNIWACVSAHVLIDGVSPEIDFTNCRFGRNGNDDLNTGSAIYLAGVTWDTLRITDCQLDIGVGFSAAQFIAIDGYNNQNGIVTIIGGHFESFTGAFLTLTPSTVLLRRLKIVGASITSVNSALPLISYANGQLDELIVSSSSIYCNFTLDGLTTSNLTGNEISGSSNFLVNACGGSVTGNCFLNAVKLQGSMIGFMFVSNKTGGLTDVSVGFKAVANNI